MHVCVHACMRACVHTCACVCTYMYMCTFTCILILCVQCILVVGGISSVFVYVYLCTPVVCTRWSEFRRMSVGILYPTCNALLICNGI